jgi:glycosyltransferase involved in cell wall biosynthesis
MRKKRIGIDARLYFQTGVGVYIRNLLYYLQELDTSNYEFYVYLMDGDADKVSFSKDNFVKRSVPYKWHSFVEQVGYLVRLIADQLDLMHFTYFSHRVLYNRPFISTIHDVIILEHKTGRASTHASFFYNIKHAAFRYALTHQIKKSKTIITPTHTIKNNIIKLFGDKYASKIQVTYEGVDYKKEQVKVPAKIDTELPEKFFLYVGNFYPHKNVERLIEAFSHVSGEEKLVFVGPSDFFSKRMQEKVKKLHLEERVAFYFNLPDEDLQFMYKHAQALVHPSLSEGLGLPLVEAVYMNLPVIASDISVYKEILGDTYTAFDPENVEDIAKKIQSFIKNPPKPDYSAIRKSFSFPEMARKTLKIYEK